MQLSEFGLIGRYFNRASQHKGLIKGVGDDCAVINIEPHMQLLMTVDTLVEGVHFSPDVQPDDLGYKALAVSLSDLAACGAEPRYATLAITLPQVDHDWLQMFSSGLFELAGQYNVDLIGGDTTRGPLTVTIQASGVAPHGQALLRNGAREGDLIYVTGQIGDAGLALQSNLNQLNYNDVTIHKRLNRPEPRVQAGLELRQLASACIDVSDGLLADLAHILKSSQVGAGIELSRLDLSESVRRYQEHTGRLDFAVTAGDDYELCFTVPPEHQNEIDKLSRQWPFHCSLIGAIDHSDTLTVLNNGDPLEIRHQGFQHFS
ncbi:MAG: thiamine-phosphate kinase [Gammaproteobacteria bacterium]|nr:thiamine-phosphate kinase [Gammaproteobacteria bacterium]